MTEIRFEELKIPAAGLHGENPLPDIKGLRQRLGEIKFSDEICEDEKEYFYYGRIKSILPYCIQDDYDRAMKTRAFKACVLENEYLRATFLPELVEDCIHCTTRKTREIWFIEIPCFNLQILRSGMPGFQVEWSLILG